jgi:WD40 repeat protein
VAFGPDGKTVASGSEDETVKLWNVQTGENTATLPGGSIVGAVAFSPDGKTLAAGSNDRTIKLWDMPAARQADR